MANTRIKDLTTTATSAASDDYLALDGATNGTRKILASDIGGGATLYIEVNGNQYEVTGFEKATVSGITGMYLYYDDGNNGSIFFADGPAMADVESTIIAQIPTATSDLTNDSGFITDAGVTSFNGNTGAVTYTAPVTSVNGNTGAVTVIVPTKTSDLTNDSGFLTTDDDTTYAISISGNVITLTGSDSTTSTVTLPVYNGGVS